MGKNPKIRPFDPTKYQEKSSTYVKRLRKKHDRNIKRKTGFKDERQLLAYVAVICNADIKEIEKRTSVLTWYEEWVMFFEFKWGRTFTRWEDICDEDDGYGIDKKAARLIFDTKEDAINKCRESWHFFQEFTYLFSHGEPK